jgi:catechol 2,3-dioxygenase-like lactoylglutathione lyase family enzyme
MIKELAHLCFDVRDLNISLAFYVNTLGLVKSFDFLNDKGERFGVYLKVGRRSFIELFQVRNPEFKDQSSYRHMCLEVEDLKSTVSELRTKGVTISDPKLGCDESWQSWLADPDGNRIELHQYTAKSWQTPHVS